MKVYFVSFLLLIGLSDSAIAFWNELPEEDVKFCRRMAAKEQNEFSAKLTYKECKKKRKIINKKFKEKQNWCKRNKSQYILSIYEENKLYKEIYEWDKNGRRLNLGKVNRELFDILKAKYGELDKRRRWMDYPAEDFKDSFPKTYKYIRHREKMKKFKECNFYDSTNYPTLRSPLKHFNY